MKKYLLGILFILTIINMVESRLTADHENKVNLKTLLEASSASAAGEYSCICVKCPEEEHGCLYYDYSVPADPNNPEIKQDILMMDKAIFALVIKEEVGLKNMQ